MMIRPLRVVEVSSVTLPWMLLPPNGIHRDAGDMGHNYWIKLCTSQLAMENNLGHSWWPLLLPCGVSINLVSIIIIWYTIDGIQERYQRSTWKLQSITNIISTSRKTVLPPLLAKCKTFVPHPLVHLSTHDHLPRHRLASAAPATF